uniref:E3 ubiquitin-protein ligase n=1 Tax=Gongylonema pulchrum TaxID=637853 RepID=A0A183EI74_9BILA
LNLSVHCTDVQAMVLATLIDREGRASVRNAPLALTIGDILLTDKIDHEDGYMEDDTLMAHIMKCDSALWKGARVTFHQMIMTTVLMDNYQKQIFSRLYVQVHWNSNQPFFIFTVPTIARILIAEECALKFICDGLTEHCVKYIRSVNGPKFDFSSRSSPHALRRSLYMLYDLKYLLSVVPAERDWTPTLRENFYNGCVSLIQFLSYMQDMDEVRRLTAQHQVWELEWETAFNIQIKLQDVLTLIIAWANSDVRFFFFLR